MIYLLQLVINLIVKYLKEVYNLTTMALLPVSKTICTPVSLSLAAPCMQEKF